MSESRDQSYYEIALTNRQVMSIFVVLLICILGAFLGGVWLGRDADAAVEMASTQSIVATAAGEAPLEELDFFTRRDQAAKAPERLEEASTKLEGIPAVADSRTQPAAAQPPASKPVERPDEPPSKPALGLAAGVETGGATPVPDAVVIQVFSSNEEAQARRVVEQLRKSGYPAILSPVEVAGRVLHRVRIGPYTDPDEAKVVAESVRRTFKFDTWITH